MRLFFDVRKPITSYDYNGCEFDSVADAVIAAKALADELRAKQAIACDAMNIAVMHESGTLVHEEMAFGGQVEYRRPPRPCGSSDLDAVSFASLTSQCPY
jgi:hypothetical protein